MLSMLTLTGLAFAQSADDQKSPVTEMWVMKVTHMAVTPPLYSLKNKYVSTGLHEAEEVKRPPVPDSGPIEGFTDPLLQTFSPATLSLNLGANYDGVGESFTGPNGTYSDDSVPPDTDMAAGTTQIVSLDNSAFAVFSKSNGAVLAGPYNTNTLWNALGSSNDCYVNDNGDGIVKFDQLAQRWIITQFQVSTSPFHQCVAVSLSSDATGSWTVFEFVPNAAHGYFPDYPKLSVWPNVYSMTFDLFNSSGTTYEAAGICGINRAALLAGSNPTIVCASLASTDYAVLPVDLDGANYPPVANTNALYIEQSQSSPATAIYMYSAAYNFAVGTVSVGAKQTITVGSYAWGVCGTSSTYCVVQPTYSGAVGSAVQNGTFSANTKLDTLGEHMMFRAAYRNFGSYESITLSQTVKGSGTNQAAERWYEIRSPFGTPTVNQQSTWSPDSSLHRWMGSIAQDHQGNMALGYSGSDSAVFPSVYVTGRLSTDTVSTMESEVQLYAGAAQQVALQGYSTVVGERWGDYSSMMLDPDDCTFWYTGEYLKQVGSFNWSTRILSFSFPSCSSPASITLPVPKGEGGAALTSATATFYWMPGSGSPTGYTLSVGSTQGGSNYFTNTYAAGTSTATVTTLPVDGSTFWVRLTAIGGVGGFQDYQYTAASLIQGQTITFTTSAPASAAYNSSFGVAATASSGLTVAFTASGVCSVVDHGNGTATYTMTSGTGTCSVIANQAGNGSYSAAPTVTETTSATKASQTVTFTTQAPSSAVYGSQFSVAATGGLSGNPVTFSSAGGCSNVGALYTMISGTVACSVIASQAGNSNYASGQTTETTNATPAVLTVSAINASMNYGDAAFPAFSANITGYVNGDGPGVVSGSPAFNTNATLSSPPGQYTLFVTQGTLAAANYTFTFVNAFLNIAQAASVTNLGANPTTIGTGDSTTLTVTVTGSPNGVAPTGTVTFYNGATVLGTGGLTGEGPKRRRNITAVILARGKVKGGPQYPGLASTATLVVSASALQFGANPNITASYGGDSNYNGGASTAQSVTVVNPGLYSPPPGSTLTGNSATFSWYGAAGATAYWIDLGNVPGGNQYYQSGSLPTTTESVTVNSLPSDGSTVYVTLYYFISGSWVSNPYTYTAFGGSAVQGQITSPTPNTTFTGTTVTFTWSAGSGSTAYWLDAGNVPGGNQYYQSGNLGNVLTTTVTTMPSDGSTVYVTLYSLVSGQWLSNAYTYTAYSLASAGGTITTPTPGSVLTSSSVTFIWNAGSGATNYWLDVGSTPGGNQYEQSGALGNVTQTTVNGLPTDGSTIYVTLYSLIGGVWSGNAYTYTALNGSGGLAAMQTPTPGTELSGNQATFTWSNDPNATAYWLDIGSVVGGNQYYQSGNLGAALTTTVSSLPADGSTIYVTLYSYVGGQWLSNAYTYTSGP